MDVQKSELEYFLIEGTAKTPEIEFKVDEMQVLLRINGCSILDNSIEFYKPLLNILEEYGKKPSELIKVDINLKYFNCSSSKSFFDIFKKLESIHKTGSNVIINWYYNENDRDMLGAGEDFESIIRVPFKMIETTN